MRLKPLGNRVVLQYQEEEEAKTQSGIILPDSAKEKPQTAVVIAVGPGKDGDGKEMMVKEGDRVIYSQYSGTEIKLDEEEYIIVDQSDIIAIIE